MKNHSVEYVLKEARRFVKLLEKDGCTVGVLPNFKVVLKGNTDTALNQNRAGALGWMVLHYHLTADDIGAQRCEYAVNDESKTMTLSQRHSNDHLDVWECSCGTTTPVPKGAPRPSCEYCRRVKEVRL